MSGFERVRPTKHESQRTTPFRQQQGPPTTPTTETNPPDQTSAGTVTPLVTPGEKTTPPSVSSVCQLFGPLYSAVPTQTTKAQNTPEQQKQLDDATQIATKQLSTGFLNPVRDSEARLALKTLSGLPPELQGQAIAKLDEGSFRRLLEETPAAEREQFQSLMTATSDPARKLQLFAEYHKSKVRNDASRDREQTKDEGWLLSQSPAQKQNEQTNRQRQSIVEHTEEEVDGELALLLQKAKDGKLSPLAVQNYICAKESEHSRERSTNINNYSTLEGLPDEDRAAFVRQSMEKKLSSGLFNPVTDGESTDALRTLQSLPQHLQGKVLEGLDKGAFDRFLSHVPDKKPEDWKALYESTHDPERKLLLWAEYHKAQATGDAKQREEQGGSGDAERRNKLRGNAANETQSEVDDEVAYLLKDIRDGKATEKDILALNERKQIEHQLEMDYNINLTSDRGSDGGFLGLGRKRERVVWKLEELKLLQASFSRLPKDAISNNHALEEIHREQNNNGDTGTGGYHDGRMIKMFDSGSGTTSQPNSSIWRFDGEESRLGGHPKGQEVTPFEAVLVHELGHAVHDKNGPAAKIFARYQQMAGWQNYSKSELKEALRAGLLAEGKTPEEIDKIVDDHIGNLQDHREDEYYDRPTVTINGQTYEVDPYSGRFLSYKEGSIPNDPRWDYARSNPADHFAEHYSMAVHHPEKLHEDLVTKPKADVDARQAELVAKSTALSQMEKDPKADKKELAALRADVASTQKNLELAQSSMTAMEQQWSLMRNEVFHTDSQVQADSQEIQQTVNSMPIEKQAEAKKLQAQFDADVKMCATPEQVSRLRKQLETSLAGL